MTKKNNNNSNNSNTTIPQQQNRSSGLKFTPQDKTILNKNNDNYRSRHNDLFLLLKDYNVNSYIEEQKNVKLNKRDIKNPEEYIQVPGTRGKVYASSVTKDRLRKKQLILKELDNMRFDERKESMSIFISRLNKLFNELSDLGDTMTDREKFNYLISYLSLGLISFSCIRIYWDNWEECCEVLIECHPFYNRMIEKRNKRYNNSKSFYSESNNYKNYKNNYRKHKNFNNIKF